MSTGKHWRAAAGAAGFAFTLFFTGCGGGGDSGTTAVAPASLQGRSYDFSPNTGGQTAVTFASSTVYTYQHETGAVEQGTYQAARDGNTWSVTLLSTTGGQQIYNLTFNSESSGSFVLKRDGEADRFGPFSARSAAVSAGDLSTTTATTSGDSSGTTTNPTGATTSEA